MIRREELKREREIGWFLIACGKWALKRGEVSGGVCDLRSHTHTLT